MRDDGSCPSCGRVLVDPSAADADAPRAPWHFKLLVLALALYLAWRFVQLLAMAA